MWCVKIRGQDGSVFDAREIPADEFMLETGGVFIFQTNEFWGFGATRVEAEQQAREYMADHQ